MSDITVFIAEDEPRARQMLRRLVLEDDRLLLVGSAADGKKASSEINQMKPDLLFLDINIKYFYVDFLIDFYNFGWMFYVIP